MSKRILIADDEPHVIHIVKRALEGDGYIVSTAPNGVVALGMFKAEPFDALISDIQMPQMDGLTLCAELQKTFPESNFLTIVMTSMTERDARTVASKLRNTQFLEKPVSPRRLLVLLKQYFAEPAGAPA